MSNHYEWGDARSAEHVLTTRADAPEHLDTDSVTEPYALFIGTANGDGVILEDSPHQIVRWVDRLHQRVHAYAARRALT